MPLKDKLAIDARLSMVEELILIRLLAQL